MKKKIGIFLMMLVSIVLLVVGMSISASAATKNVANASELHTAILLISRVILLFRHRSQ